VHILTDVDHIGPNSGAEVSTFQITRELVRRGHEVDVAYLQPGGYEADYRNMCGTVVQVPILDMGLRPRPKTLWGMQSAVRTCAKLKPDVVYDNRYYSAAWARGVATLSRSKVVCHVRGFNESPRVTDKILSRLAHTFITVSDFVRDGLIERGANPKRVHTVHNGIDPDEYPYGDDDDREAARHQLNLPADAFMVLFYGRIDPIKGPEVLLEAVRHLRLAEGEIVVLFAGQPVTPDYERELRATAPPGCRWLPLQSDVVTLLHAADVVALPALWDEPFGRTIIETMASGRPVVASRSGGTPEILRGEWSRFLFERGDAEELADRLQSLIDWRAHDPDLGKRCREYVVDNFSIERMADGIERQLLDAAKGRG
jgi:glycosyltransferase involved in cell wall biosynthesis